MDSELIEHTLEQMRRDRPSRYRLQWQQAEDWLRQGFTHYLGEDFLWMEDYGKLVEWMRDSEHKGLCIFGGCGVGKSLFLCRIFPRLLYYTEKRIVHPVDARDLAQCYEEVAARDIVVVDDVGTEEPVYLEYGNRRMPFADLVARCERDGKLLLFTTNLSLEEMTERYGERTASRLRHIVRGVRIIGKDMRK